MAYHRFVTSLNFNDVIQLRNVDINFTRATSSALVFNISLGTSASLVTGRNSNPSGEISLSYMDTHDGLL